MRLFSRYISVSTRDVLVSKLGGYLHSVQCEFSYTLFENRGIPFHWAHETVGLRRVIHPPLALMLKDDRIEPTAIGALEQGLHYFTDVTEL